MAKKNENIIPKDNNIIGIPLEEAMPENYLPYAIEVAKDRALPMLEMVLSLCIEEFYMVHICLRPFQIDLIINLQE